MFAPRLLCLCLAAVLCQTVAGKRCRANQANAVNNAYGYGRGWGDYGQQDPSSRQSESSVSSATEEEDNDPPLAAEQSTMITIRTTQRPSAPQRTASSTTSTTTTTKEPEPQAAAVKSDPPKSDPPKSDPTKDDNGGLTDNQKLWVQLHNDLRKGRDASFPPISYDTSLEKGALLVP